MTEEYRSGLSEDELRDLERRIIDIVCEERPSLHNKLESSTVRDVLIEKGTEPPDYAMADAFDHLKVWFLTTFLGGPQNPIDRADDEALRRHGGITIVGIKSPDACDV